MTDIVERLRCMPAPLVWHNLDESYPLAMQLCKEAADEIERLREVLTIMIPHIEHMVRNAEDAKQVDTDFIRNRLYDARAALGEGE